MKVIFIFQVVVEIVDDGMPTFYRKMRMIPKELHTKSTRRNMGKLSS